MVPVFNIGDMTNKDFPHRGRPAVQDIKNSRADPYETSSITTRRLLEEFGPSEGTVHQLIILSKSHIKVGCLYLID